MDSYLQRLQQAIASATEGMTAEELVRHPEGKWCASEVLEHLYLSYTGTVMGFSRCLDGGRPLGRKPTPWQRFRALVVADLGYFPTGRQAPEHTRPRGLACEKVLTELASTIARMDELISRCTKQYGEKTRLLDHPILGPLTAKQWCKFHWVHGRHHMKQIQRLRRMS
jgi:hypothetical protein